MTDAQLRGLAEYETSPVFTNVERAVLRYADAITDTPVVVSDEVFAGVRTIFDDRQLVELTSCLAWENYRARFDHALGVESEGFSGAAYCALPNRG